MTEANRSPETPAQHRQSVADVGGIADLFAAFAATLTEEEAARLLRVGSVLADAAAGRSSASDRETR